MAGNISDHFENLVHLMPVPLTAFEALHRPRLITLNYHLVSDQSLAHIRHIYSYKSTRDFNADLKFLSQRYRFVSYPQVVDGTAFAGAKERVPVLITFDDSLVECHSVVAPILAEWGVSAVFFLVTGLINNHRFYSKHLASLLLEKVYGLGEAERTTFVQSMAPAGVRDLHRFKKWLLSQGEQGSPLLEKMCVQLDVDVAVFLQRQKPYLDFSMVQDLARRGHTIGAHSCSHARLGRLAPADVRAEILNSIDAIRQWTGQASVPFAFPFNGTGVDRDLLRQLRRDDAKVGLFFDSKDLNPDADFVFNRVWTDHAPRKSGSSNLSHLLRVAHLKRYASKVF
jgi:peptidoglycan/xylan/chitin deacetylase (PgdA/CDA1 family)